ncbi:hypothetical protein MGYG_01891 [Nannizzia gypsea CBS 118893]|uniref:Uncharacterized protein n=1 Tax=Arthroderma gypseum (strain ATCC MYA-4604 / CBS 118893) TaxID=535722 RepID=E5QYL3_ARTGP|nr:hypothetical protein MGYG_01891 [Nannizzia gypsea CBS 118893]EFQ98876.1 hypothetical protein MGYG_01891 [Nannizzia gypsea CBS 118893]
MHNHNHHHHHHSPYRRPRDNQRDNEVPVPVLVVRSAPLPDHRIPLLSRIEEPAVAEPMARPLERRDVPDTTRLVPRRDATCSPDNNAGKDCGPGLTETPTVAIALGVAIPLVCAFIAFFILHRRHVKKLRKEDEQDKIKALDYGLEDVPASTSGAKVRPGGGQGVEKGPGGGHQPGMSMDWTMDNPYFLPPGLQKSRGSLHSLSRTMPGEDKYGVAFDGNGSIRSNTPSHRHNNADDNSSYTAGSSRNVGGSDANHHNGGLGDDMSQNLLRNAQRMSTSPPLAAVPAEPPSPPQPAHFPSDTRYDELGLPSSLSNNYSNDNKDINNHDSNNYNINGDDSQMGAAGSKDKDPALRSSHNYLGQFIHSGSRSPTPDDHKKEDSVPGQQDGHPSLPGLAFSTNDGPKLDFNLGPSSQPTATTVTDRQQADVDSDYGDESKPTPGLPQFNIMPAEDQKHLQQQKQQQHHGDEDTHGYPEEEDDGTDNIHDVYDQYYDSNHLIDTRRLTMGIRPLPPEDPSDNPEQRANRIRSFYKEYFDDSKPFQQDYIEDYGEVPPLPNPAAPFAQPLPRRAMTPPPRMPPAFPPRRHPGVGHQPPPGMNMGFAHSATNSLSSGHPMAGPRAFSSASGRIPHPRQKKPLPPPSPLHVLPTPHKLKDDMFLPVDFAPGPRVRDRQAGRPETPLGGLQHYNLMVPSHSPLVSSFDELPSVPSPHALRKSGTFTALDFAPPPRFKNESGSGSDAGSIRSNRTGISAMQAHNIRAGAYRVSRLPAETVGTRDDFSSNLKPQWEMRT